MSYGEIRKETGMAKSTLSFWLKNIKLSKKHLDRFYNKRIRNLSLGAESQRERRNREVEEILRQAQKEIKFPVSQNALKLIGASLYWAEGSKGKMFNFTNSDPFMILFIVEWIKKILDVKPEYLKAKLNIYPQQNDNKIKQFWSTLTGIPVENFGKSYIKPLSSGYKKNNLYYGTIRVTIPKSTDINYRIFGWVKSMIREIAPDVEMTKERWKILEKTERPANL